MIRRRASGLAWIAALLGILAGPSVSAASASAQSAVVDWREVTVYFDLGSAELTPAGFDLVREFAGQFDTMAAGRIVLRGHTDTLGDAEDNLILSRRRAEAVRAALITAGIEAEIAVDGYSESVLARHTADGVPEPLNRRVTISVEP